MAKNYQKCLSYLDFENSDFYFTDEQKEEIIQKFDMYFVLSSTEYQIEQIAKMLLRLESDEYIWKTLGLRTRQKVKPFIRKPPHINKLLRMPPDFDITIIFKDSLKYQLEDLNEVCRKSKYSIYPYHENPNRHYSDYDDYAYLPDEIKKNRKLSYQPAPPEYAEMQRRKNKDTMDRMRSHFIEAERETYVPIPEEKLDPKIIKAEQKNKRKNELFNYVNSLGSAYYNGIRKTIIDRLIETDKKVTKGILERMLNSNISDEAINKVYSVYYISNFTADIIYSLLTPGLSVAIVSKLIDIIRNKNISTITYRSNILRFIEYCVECSIEDTEIHNMHSINRFISVYNIYYTKSYKKYLIQNINKLSDKMITSIKMVYDKFDCHPKTIIRILNICETIGSGCTDRHKIVFNAIAASENGVSDKDIEYGIKHCSDSSAKMWLLMRMAEHGLPLDNPDIDHIVFDGSILHMLQVMNNDEYPVEMILEMIEGLVNHYGIRHRYYTISEISSYFDIYIRRLNDNLNDYKAKFDIKGQFTKKHMYAHTIHYIRADGLFNGRINISNVHSRYFDGTFNDMNDILSGRRLKYIVTPDCHYTKR